MAENLGEIWGLNTEQVDEALNQELTADEKAELPSLDEFDFGDF